MKPWIYSSALSLAMAALIGCNDSSGSGNPASSQGSEIVGTWYAAFVSAGGESHKLLALNADHTSVEYDTTYPVSDKFVAKMTATWALPEPDSLVLSDMQLYTSWDSGLSWGAPKSKGTEGTLFVVSHDSLMFFTTTSQSIWVRRH